MLASGTAAPGCRGSSSAVLTTELRLASSCQTLPSFRSGLRNLPRTGITSLISTDLACTGGPANSRELSIAKQDRRVLCLILRKIPLPWSLLPLGAGRDRSFLATSEPLGLRLLSGTGKSAESQRKNCRGSRQVPGPHRREIKAVVTRGLREKLFRVPHLKMFGEAYYGETVISSGECSFSENSCTYLFQASDEVIFPARSQANPAQ